jgi:Arc/MetJ-type ribon-helix-helix transcriptional regulator
MEIILKPELESFIKEKIASGQYQSIDEAIEERL